MFWRQRDDTYGMNNTGTTRPTPANLRPNKTHADAQRLLDDHLARLAQSTSVVHVFATGVTDVPDDVAQAHHLAFLASTAR